MSTDETSRRAIFSHPLFQLVLARLREFWREPMAIFWVYGFPLLMALVLGIAFRDQPVERSRIDIEDEPGAKAILSTLESNERFDARIYDPATCRTRLRTGKTELVVASAADSSAEYEYRFDPTRPGSLLARNAVDDALQRAAGREDVAATRNVEMNEPGGRYIDFLIPGLIGLGLMGGGMWGVGFAIVDLRIRKLLKRFLGTPMRRSYFLLSIMISRLIFTVPEVILLLVFAWLVFGVVIHGSVLTVMLIVFLGAFQFAGIGLLVASRTQTLESVSGIMNLVMLPMWIGSGVFFSIENYPDSVQPMLRLLPLTPLINALRTVMLEGATITSIGYELIAIIAWSFVTFVLALRLFRWN